MYRFIAIIQPGNNSASDDQHAALKWRIGERLPDFEGALDSRALSVFHVPTPNGDLHTYPLHGSAGIILGRLFQTDSQGRPSPIADIDTQTAGKIRSSRGRELLQSYWGAYVAIINDSNNHRQCVIRDCTGKIPCFITQVGSLWLVFSDMTDVSRLAVGRFSINWRYLAAFLKEEDLRVRETGLNEVRELLAGDSWTHSRNGVEHSVAWRPADVWRRGSISEYGAAVRALRDATQLCVDAWCLVHRQIVHRLSGGLDSAIVLACAMRAPAPPDITCLNRFTGRQGEDERQYARLMAKAVDVELIESPWHAQGVAIDASKFGAQLLVKPSVQALLVNDVEFTNRLARDCRAVATWTGQGGDHLFLQPPLDLYAADYVYEHGFISRFGESVRNGARLTRKSYWSVLRCAIAYGVIRRSWKPVSVIPTHAALVRREALPANFASFVRNPWLTDVDDLPRGKQFHIALLANLVNRAAPTARLEIAPQHHPMISQPLIETCLRISTYMHSNGGHSRALARDAFRAWLPPEIANRQDKGESTSYMMKFVRENVGVLKPLLLDGILVRENLVSRAQMEKCLSRPLGDMQLFPMLACISGELWARTWLQSAADNGLSANARPFIEHCRSGT
jgi:asparagine synthase (glutamine-hydrolysing)